MAATDFGVDVSTFPDLDPAFALMAGPRVVGEALARRLVTPRGSLVDNPNYGTDVRVYLGEPMSNSLLTRCRSDVDRESRLDERVLTLDVAVSFDPPNAILKITLAVTTANGPFLFVLAVTALTVTLLQSG